MVKVVNLVNRTIEVASVQIKPHTVHIFDTLTLAERQKLSAMSAVGIVRAYDGEYSNQEANTVSIDNNIDTTEKPVRRANKKK